MSGNNNQLTITRAQVLLDRLERISADSQWAHQASGIRASIAKSLTNSQTDLILLERLLDRGFNILEKAAAEIPED